MNVFNLKSIRVKYLEFRPGFKEMLFHDFSISSSGNLPCLSEQNSWHIFDLGFKSHSTIFSYVTFDPF